MLLIGVALNPLLSKTVHADGWEFMPDSRHNLFENYGLIFDEQCTLVNFENARLWAGMGGSVPVYGNNDLPYHPQFVFHASANSALHYDSNFRFYSETFDARFGMDIEFAINRQLRASIGVQHNSGHAADGIDANDQQTFLFAAPLGQEFIPMKVFYDLDQSFRFGAAFKPFIRSAPSMEFAQFDEIIEWFTLKGNDDTHHPSPYIALGLEQSGPSSLTTSVNAQLGLYFGNHFSEHFHQTMRWVLGYYNGADWRLKYFQFLNQTQAYFYAGAMFNL